MKTVKSMLAMLLTVSLLMGLCGGLVYADAAPPELTTVAVEPSLAFAPLEQPSQIAYEQHEDGYEVALERTA